MNKNTFEIINDAGEKIVCNILFTFDSDETGKSYMAYTDNSVDENGSMKVYASIFDPNDPNTRLEAITSDKEWKVVETILQALQDEIKNKMEAEDNESGDTVTSE